MRQNLAVIAASFLFTPVQVFAQDAPAQSDRVSMTSAIQAAQARIDGGVLEAEIETEDGALVYEIDLAQGSDVYEVTVDAQSGEVVSQSEEQLTSLVSGLFQEEELRVASSARDILIQALTEIEAQADARIEELSLDEEDGRMVYEVEVQDATGEREMLIDATTGEVVAEQD